MKRGLWLMAATLCYLVPVMADQSPENPIEPPKVASFSGIIQTLDARNRTLEVKAAVFTKKFAAAPDCEILIKEKPKATIDDLNIGDQVNVTYQELAQSLVAHRIEQLSVTPVEEEPKQTRQPDGTMKAVIVFEGSTS